MASAPAFRKFAAYALLLGVAAMLSAGTGHADKGRRLNQDQVLQGVNSGEIKPLADVLAVAVNAVPGRVIRVEVERLRGKIVYELKIMTDTGRVRECYIDAATLEVLKVD